MKTQLCRLLLVTTLAGLLNAHAVTPMPVWEFLINQSDLPVPVMTNILNDVTDSDFGDGRSVLATFGPLKRYDANRLLFGVRENGVDETAQGLTADQLWVSTNYPDRSLVWLDVTTGRPTGIALKMGLYPVPIPDWFRDGASAAGVNDYTNQYYWSFEVSADGYIYSSYRNMILRYAPDGQGGISATPQVVFTLEPENNGVPVAGNLYTTAGRFPILRVRGTAANTVILAGGMSGSRGAYRISTSNGTDFTATAFMPGGWGNCGSGSFSQLIPGLDPLTPGEEWVYGGWFPGNSSGADSKFSRMVAVPPFDSPNTAFAAASAFNPQPDPGTATSKFTANFIGSVGAHPDLGYVLAYSTPSWNSGSATSGQFWPGWLAVLDATNGNFIASHPLNVIESDALLTSDGTSKWEGTYGWVDLNKLPNGDVEALWSSGLYGYGRYLMKNTVRITNFEFAAGYPAITFLGDGRGQVQRASKLAPEPDWQNVGSAMDSGSTVLDDTAPLNAPAILYRVLMVP